MPTKSGVTLTARQRRLIGDRLAERGAKCRVGRAVGCAGQHLSGIVAGRKHPSQALLRRLCRELGLDLDLGRVTIGGR